MSITTIHLWTLALFQVQVRVPDLSKLFLFKLKGFPEVVYFRKSSDIYAPNLPLSSSMLHCAAQRGLFSSVSPRPSSKAPLPLHGFCSDAASISLAQLAPIAPPALRQLR